MQPEALCCCCSQNYVCSNFLGICKHKFISIVEFQMNILYVSIYMELTHERKTTRILAGLVDTEMHFVCVSLSPVTMSPCLCQLNLAYCLLSLSIIQAAKLNLPIFCRLCDFHACWFKIHFSDVEPQKQDEQCIDNMNGKMEDDVDELLLICSLR